MGDNKGAVSNCVFAGTVETCAAYGAIAGQNISGTLANNYYTACTVNGVVNATGVGCGSSDITANNGAVPALRDNANNSPAIAQMVTASDMLGHLSVSLTGRTLYKGGDWNTLCLPFDLFDNDDTDNISFTGTPLEGAVACTLTEASFSGTTLTLNFSDPVETLLAGTPYIIKWTGTQGTLTDTDLVFNGVTIDNTMYDKAFTNVVTFKGTYDAQTFDADNRSILFLGEGNKLFWPQSGARIGACRAYFQLADGITAGDIAGGARLFFGSNESQGIISIENGKLNIDNETGSWYTLDGKKLSQQPTRKGIYIHDGHKAVIK